MSEQGTGPGDRSSPADDPGSALLAVVAALVTELGRDARGVNLDARLDADLGLDSLTRVELLARIEDALGVRLPDAAVVEAETPRDLLNALGEARPAGDVARDWETVARVPDAGGGSTRMPLDLPTLVDALEWHAATHPDRVHVHFIDEEERVHEIRYGALLDEARRVAGGIVERGVSPGQMVAIMLPTSREYLVSFVAILLAGATPVPIYPPARAKQIQEHFQRHARILDNAGVRMLITFDQVKQVSRLLAAQVAGLEHLVTPADLEAGRALDLRPALTPDHVAFLQYTSGSTGDPKGVVLTHANILASLRCMREALEVTQDDVFVSWLPLYHDMGLIGAWLGSLVVGFPLVLMSPLSFLARPERWLQAVDRFGATVSGGPNFAYELCTRRVPEAALSELDLSRWRLAFNGAEPVVPETLERFADRFAAAGFEPRAMTPVYGLAEATLGVAFTPAGRGPKVDRISRGELHAHGEARATGGDDSLAVVSSGVAIPEFQVRVVDAAGREAADRHEGEIEFLGPGATGGYHRNSEASARLFNDRWVRTGDRGYLADGELYVTGRDKDVVIRAGRNLYPYALEQAVAEVPGVRRGCVAVFGGVDPGTGTERLVVLAETRESGPQQREEMSRAIEALTLEHLELPADEVVLAPPHTVLKTSSGKIRRAALAERYAAGKLFAPVRAPWLQVVSLMLRSLLPAARRGLRRLSETLYAGWFALMLGLHLLWAWPAVSFLPGAHNRWRAARLAARSLLACTGIRLTVSGPQPSAGILVANHQSYLDGLVLVAALDAPASFVAKAELRSSAFSRCFLDGLGVLYVERFDRGRGLADAEAVAGAVASGRRVVFFPEGTFHRMPGLLPFQLGAFDTALRHGATLAPTLLDGTRHVLRGDEMFVRRSPVRVRFLPAETVPVASPDSRWREAIRLRDRIRGVMLAASPEPDLSNRNALAELAARRSEE